MIEEAITHLQCIMMNKSMNEEKFLTFNFLPSCSVTLVAKKGKTIYHEFLWTASLVTTAQTFLLTINATCFWDAIQYL